MIISEGNKCSTVQNEECCGNQAFCSIGMTQLIIIRWWHSWCSCYICSYLSRISIAGSRHFLRTDRFRRQRRCPWMPKPPRIEWRWVMKCVACRTAVLLPNKTCLCPHQQSWSQAGPLFSFLSTLEWSWLQLALFTSDNVSSPSFESKLNETKLIWLCLVLW